MSTYRACYGLTVVFSDLRAVVSGKDVPEEVKSRLLSMHEDGVRMKEELKTLTDKLAKARAVRLRIFCDVKLFIDHRLVHQAAGQAIQGRTGKIRGWSVSSKS
jgi:hypothetical protein